MLFIKLQRINYYKLIFLLLFILLFLLPDNSAAVSFLRRRKTQQVYEAQKDEIKNTQQNIEKAIKKISEDMKKAKSDVPETAILALEETYEKLNIINEKNESTNMLTGLLSRDLSISVIFNFLLVGFNIILGVAGIVLPYRAHRKTHKLEKEKFELEKEKLVIDIEIGKNQLRANKNAEQANNQHKKN
jgi:hypothetical protein